MRLSRHTTPRIAGAAPWTRAAVAALPSEVLEELDGLLPEGTRVTVGAARRPGTWVIHLLRGSVEVARIDDVHDIPNGIRRAVRATRDRGAA